MAASADSSSWTPSPSSGLRVVKHDVTWLNVQRVLEKFSSDPVVYSSEPPSASRLSTRRVWNILRANLGEYKLFWKNPLTHSNGPRRALCVRMWDRINGCIHLHFRAAGLKQVYFPFLPKFPLWPYFLWKQKRNDVILCQSQQTRSAAGIPLFFTSSASEKSLPCAVTQSFSWLPCLLVISFSISMLFSLLPPLLYYQGSLCQTRLIWKVSGSFLHSWAGKSDRTPQLRGQLQ